jgi:hypothetical protein
MVFYQVCLDQLFKAEFDLDKIRQTSGNSNPQIEFIVQQISKLKPSIVTSLNNLKIRLQAEKLGLQKDNKKVMASLGKIPKKEDYCWI